MVTKLYFLKFCEKHQGKPSEYQFPCPLFIFYSSETFSAHWLHSCSHLVALFQFTNRFRIIRFNTHVVWKGQSLCKLSLVFIIGCQCYDETLNLAFAYLDISAIKQWNNFLFTILPPPTPIMHCFEQASPCTTMGESNICTRHTDL